MLTQHARLRIRDSFPAVLWPDVDVAISYLDPLYEDPASSVSPHSIGPIRLNGEQLSIPYRLYLLEPEPDRLSALTNIQQLILSAILSRSSNGFVREKCVGELLRSDELWIPPFVLQLVGEYVLQIIRVVQDHSEVLKRPEYRRFIIENPAFFPAFETANYQLLELLLSSYVSTAKRLPGVPDCRVLRRGHAAKIFGSLVLQIVASQSIAGFHEWYKRLTGANTI